ncbi:hypothetical protein B6D19_10465 [Gilliamella apicola]|uniref:hypothetical protein n=1 Tax=Gilliamella apicola TaxID=1196095 RepID=UPI000A3405FF|nr:hypothetical protein [Gilliamella apicola]OTQ30917.1 hypothetical protein B6D19_10465 [Gilliamella apicola]OTQ42860.1 hypothetical protein B6D20_07945 [Gilliamella apicola]
MDNNKNPIFYARIVSISYVEHLIRTNGDNIFKHHLGDLELEPDSLASFLEGYYEQHLSEFERMCMYGSMIDLNKTKEGCSLKIGTTFYLNQSGIDILNNLMSSFILMKSEEKETTSSFTYH